MKTIPVTAAITILLILLSACNEGITNSSPDDYPSEYIPYSQNDVRFETVLIASTDTELTSVVEYSYDALSEELHLIHRNAVLTSDPERIDVRVAVEENILTIIEEGTIGEGQSASYYDVEMTITNLPLTAYRILFVEPNRGESQLPLTFRMDLVAALNGSFARARSVIPENDFASL